MFHILNLEVYKMERIKKFIEDYGFNVEEIRDEKVKGFYCVNPESKSEFILDFTVDNFKLVEEITNAYIKLIDKEVRVVYLMEINDNIDEIVSFLENNDNEDSVFLVYDKDDEIEFFLKDLWNVILSLKRQ